MIRLSFFKFFFFVSIWIKWWIKKFVFNKTIIIRDYEKSILKSWKNSTNRNIFRGKNSCEQTFMSVYLITFILILVIVNTNRLGKLSIRLPKRLHSNSLKLKITNFRRKPSENTKLLKFFESIILTKWQHC